MRLPRDISGSDLAFALQRFGYTATRQTGSHLRLTTQRKGEHHITIPLQDPLRIGTLSAILSSVAEHIGASRAEVAEEIFKR